MNRSFQMIAYNPIHTFPISDLITQARIDGFKNNVFAILGHTKFACAKSLEQTA